MSLCFLFSQVGIRATPAFAMGDENVSSSFASAATSASISSAVKILSLSFGHPFNTILMVKLDENNYLLWRGMVLAILRGQNVDGFVLGTNAQPSEFVEVTSETGNSLELNPAYGKWMTVNPALLG